MALRFSKQGQELFLGSSGFVRSVDEVLMHSIATEAVPIFRIPAWVASNAAGVGGNFQQQRVRYEYDRAHRLIGRFSDSGQGVSYELDPAGQVLSRSIHHGGNLSSRPTVQQYEHDALGRVQRTWIDMAGIPRAIDLTHDAMGRLSSIRRPWASGSTEMQAPVEQRQYDALGRLTRVEFNVLGAWQPIVLAHSAAGTPTSVISPSGVRCLVRTR